MDRETHYTIKKPPEHPARTTVQSGGVKINPCGDRVLVRPFTEEALRKAQGKTPSYGIILPDSVTKEKSAQGKVLAVGEGKWVVL